MDAVSPAAHGLLTGDLGPVVVRALLENGVGYVVSSWRDRPTPIDAAIDDARERVLVPHGVVLRRLRSLAALEPIVAAPSGGITGAPPRGAVVFAGRRALRPALEQFLSIRASGAVVGFCFDDEALGIEDAIVVDPEPTAIGIVRAIDEAFIASLAAQRPALVVLRERAVGMRGTIRRRPSRSPSHAADADALHRSEQAACSVSAAVEHAGLLSATVGANGRGQSQRLLVVGGPLRQAAERALAEVAARLSPAGASAIADDVAIVSLRAVGTLPEREGAIGRLLAGATDACVLSQRCDRVVERLRASGVAARIERQGVDPGRVTGEQVLAAVAGWVAEFSELDADARSLLQVPGSRSAGPGPLVDSRLRIPRRGQMLHRSVPPAVAAGLALAQGVVGVPARIDADHPTYRTDTGVPLTVVPASTFAGRGAAGAAPGCGPGVFVVTGAAGGVAEAAAVASASIEYVDGSSPRSIGVAIARACAAPRLASHVIVATDVQRVAAPRAAAFGMDPDLVGTERLATAAVPPSSTALVDLGDELLAGPAVLALDTPEAHASLEPLRELSPATWDLRRSRGSTSRASRLSWNLRRRLVRATGVDL